MITLPTPLIPSNRVAYRWAQQHQREATSCGLTPALSSSRSESHPAPYSRNPRVTEGQPTRRRTDAAPTPHRVKKRLYESHIRPYLSFLPSNHPSIHTSVHSSIHSYQQPVPWGREREWRNRGESSDFFLFISPCGFSGTSIPFVLRNSS